LGIYAVVIARVQFDKVTAMQSFTACRNIIAVLLVFVGSCTPMVTESDSTVTITSVHFSTADPEPLERPTITSVVTLSNSELITYTVPVTNDVSAIIEDGDGWWRILSTIGPDLSWQSITGQSSMYVAIANSALCEWNDDIEIVTCEGTTFASITRTSDYSSALTTEPSTQSSAPNDLFSTLADVGSSLSTNDHATSVTETVTHTSTASLTTVVVFSSSAHASITAAKPSGTAAGSGISNAGLAGTISGSTIFVLIAIPLGFFVIRRHRRRRDTTSSLSSGITTEIPDEMTNTSNMAKEEPEREGPRNHINTDKMRFEQIATEHATTIDGLELEARQYRPYAELNDTITRHELHGNMPTKTGTHQVQHELNGQQTLRASGKELWFHT